MNYFVIFLQVYVMTYMVYVFHETYRKQYHIETTRIYRYMIGSLLCCGALVFVPARYDIYLFFGLLIILPIFIYYQEKATLRQLFVYALIFTISLILYYITRYFMSVIPTIQVPFTFELDVLFCMTFMLISLFYLQSKLGLNKSLYTCMIIIMLCILWVMNIILFSHVARDDKLLFIPYTMSICLLALFRIVYTLETSKDHVLELTIQRYVNKDNKEKYEQLQKENIFIMQQMHDMKKHLKMLDGIVGHGEEFRAYKKEIEEKAEEIFVYKQTGNECIDRILQMYTTRFYKEHIQCNIEVDDVDFSFMDIIDSSALFANLFDNALESCLTCEDRFLLLKISCKKGFIVIKMKNSCNAINEENGHLRTMKNDKLYHGYGMRNMSMIADHYHGDLTYRFDSEHQIFITVISLNNNHS